MDKIRTVCGSCGAAYLVPAERLGHRIACPKCRETFLINHSPAPPQSRPPAHKGEVAIDPAARPRPSSNHRSDGGALPQLGRGQDQPTGSAPPNRQTLRPEQASGPAAAKPLVAASAVPQATDTSSWPTYTPPLAKPPSDPTPASRPLNDINPPLNDSPGGPNGARRSPGQAAAEQANGTVRPTGTGEEAAASGKEAGSNGKLQVWGEGLIINTRCPRCELIFPISKGLLDKSVNCPGCKRPFFAADNYGWLEDPNGGFWDRLMSDKRFWYALPAFIVTLLALNIFVPKIYDAYVLRSLKSALKETYEEPAYTVSITDSSKKRQSAHKTPDWKEPCSRVAFVHIVHHNSGMEFPRIMCRSAQGWTPDFTQAVADRVAYERLDNPYATETFDPGEMIAGAVNLNAANLRDSFVKSPEEQAAHEEKMIRLVCGPAISAMSKLGHDDEAQAMEIPIFSQLSADDDDEWDWDLEPDEYETFYYRGGVNSYIDKHGEEVIYKAHAVMYPQHTDELLARGLISQRP